MGRTTCAEILHGARTKKIERNSYDGLPAYGTSSRMRRADILARVDELIEAGRLAHDRRALPGAARARARCRLTAFRVAVLVSGEGTNLQAILDTVHGRDGIEVVGVARAGRRRAGSSAPRAAGVETAACSPMADHADRDARDAALGDWLEARAASS